MSDKISEALWKAFIKKQKLAVELEDKELVKALARLDKTDERKLEPRLEALKELIKEIPKQVTALTKLKKQLGDKPFGLVKDELYAIEEEAQALQKKTQAALEAEQAKDDEEDEDAKPNALINPKQLLKQLMMCRKDPERTMKFAFVDAKDKQPATLAMHPRMSARALFGKLQTATGVKTGAFGSAWVDGMSLMLQLDKPLSGLVKKVRAPVKACGFRITKAVLWNEDGTVFEQDELAEEAVAEGQAQPAPGEPAEPGSAAPTAPPPPSVTYEAKLAALQPRVKQAAETGSPDAVKHQRLMEFAAGKATAKDFAAAVAALRQVEQLLDNPTPKTEGGSVEAGVAFKARMAALIPKIKEAQTAGHPAAQEVKLKASEAGVYAGKRDFERAGAILDEVESLLEGGAPKETAPAEPTQPAGGAADDEADDGFADRLEAVKVDIQAHLRRYPDEREDIDDLVQRAQAAHGQGDRLLGHQLLDRVDNMLMAAKRAERAAEMQAAIPEGAAVANVLSAAGVEAVSLAWVEARTRAMEGAAGLAVALRSSPFAEVQPIADIVDDFIAGLPLQLDDTLSELRGAVAKDDTPKVKQFQSRGKKDVRACLDYLKAQETLVAAFEENPMDGVAVSIAAPLKQSLRGILAVLQ